MGCVAFSSRTTQLKRKPAKQLWLRRFLSLPLRVIGRATFQYHPYSPSSSFAHVPTLSSEGTEMPSPTRKQDQKNVKKTTKTITKTNPSILSWPGSIYQPSLFTKPVFFPSSQKGTPKV
jgi:hypothetical protein